MAAKVEITAESWAELKASKALVLVELYKDWTGPCAVLEPTMKTIENALAQPEKQLVFAKANVDKLKDVPDFTERANSNSIVPEFWLMVSVASCAFHLRKGVANLETVYRWSGNCGARVLTSLCALVWLLCDVLCFALLCFALLCCAVLYFALLCFALLCLACRSWLGLPSLDLAYLALPCPDMPYLALTPPHHVHNPSHSCQERPCTK